MPLYEYQCDQCGRFELIRKFSDAPLETCPTCGKDVQKLLSSPAIQFKGSGWYITDYARKSSGGKPEGKSEGKAEGKAESASATKESGGKSGGSEGSSGGGSTAKTGSDKS